jgi:phage terminase large subunit-like protein
VTVELAIQYASDVLTNKISACQLVHRACERFLNDIVAADHGTSPWEFRRDLAERPMRFFALCPNIKGPLAGQKLELMGWQALVIASLYGFVERNTDTRRFRQAVIFVPRGNSKTTMMAPLLLYSAFADSPQEGGAEAYAAAVSRDQAKLLWDTAKNMVLQTPDLAKSLGIHAAAHSIYQPKTASKCIAVSSDAKSLEGLSVHIGVCDEIASHLSSSVYDVLLTACGKRKHPLLISISTSTGNNAGIGKQLWDYGVRILTDAQQDDRFFALIYTIDEGDDPWQESTWIKCNPSWGVSVQPDAIRAIMKQARNNPAQEAAAMTRHLDIWVGADEALFSVRAWNACADSNLHIEDFADMACEVSIDLASRVDLASVSITFPSIQDGKPFYTTFCRAYINEAAVMDSNPSYAGWAKDGHLIVTSGNETDFGTIEQDVIQLCKTYQVRSISYDPWAATQMSQHLIAEGLPATEYRMNVANLSEPTKETGAAMQAGRFRHDGNPVLAFCIGGVVGHYDARQNVYPRKSPSNAAARIDCAITTIMTVGRCMLYQDQTEEVRVTIFA